jgi:hypothetical protein
MLMGGLALILVLAVSLAVVRSGRGANVPGDDEIAKLSAIAGNFAEQNGTPTGVTAEGVAVDRKAAVDLLAGGDQVDSAGDVYAVQLRGGVFTGYMAKVPEGQEFPTGTALYFVVDASSNQILDWGIDSEPQDMTSLGTTFDVPMK